MTAEQQAILDVIKGATSANPMMTSVIFENITGIGIAKFHAELEAMYQARKLNRCALTKNSVTMFVYWPTGFKGAAMTKAPIEKAPKEAHLKRTEPLKWSELKKQKNKLTIFEESDMSAKPTKTDVRKLIDAKQKPLGPLDNISPRPFRLAAINCLATNPAEDWMETEFKPKKTTAELKSPALTIQPVEALSALQTQEGGDHYKKMAIQPVQYITANNLGFIEGNIIKYVSRHKNKNGIEDLKKARHFIDILIEMQGVH